MMRPGNGEFTITFKLVGPGTVHLTIYDPANQDPRDNSYSGYYLGTVK